MNHQSSLFQDGPVVSPGAEFGSPNAYSNQASEEVIASQDPSLEIYEDKQTPQNAVPLEMAFDNENSHMQGHDSSVEFIGTSSGPAAVPQLMHHP